MANRAPKQWCLTKSETVNSFENWKQNLLYTLSLDPNFAPYLVEGLQWGTKSKTAPLHGLTDDGEDVAAAQRKTAQQKCATLDLMLGQIANYCPVIARNTIIKNSKSLNHIWQTIRLHYGFQSTGGHFLDFANIHLEPDERHEDLYQRLMAFVEDNLLVPDGGITHYGQVIEEDEEPAVRIHSCSLRCTFFCVCVDAGHLFVANLGFPATAVLFGKRLLYFVDDV